MTAGGVGIESTGEPDRHVPRPLWRTVAMFFLLACCVSLFTGLGIWQLHRLAWKQELIATVDARVQADPVAVPASDSWNELDAATLAYQRVHLAGVFDHAAEIQALAVTELGGGYWVMAPLVLDGGGTVLVNRGFVPQELRDPATRLETSPTGRVEITGFLRVSEPKGGFLRDNDPATGRWYSRDTQAIAEAKGLTAVAPFFVDADLRGVPEGTNVDAVASHSRNADSSDAGFYADTDFPHGGLTVIAFRNTHLSYALTWFALAVLSVVGIALLLREWVKDRQKVVSPI